MLSAKVFGRKRKGKAMPKTTRKKSYRRRKSRGKKQTPEQKILLKQYGFTHERKTSA